MLLGLPSTAQTLTTIHVISLPIDAGAEVFYGKAMGFFAKAGIDIDILPASNGGASASAVAGNAADIGYADMVSIATAHAKGVDFQVVVPAALHVSAAPTTQLLVAANSPIHTAKDLEGKIVAGSGLGTISGYSPKAWIDQNGGDSTKVKFVELPFPAMQAALDTGRVDAVMIAEPFLAEAKKVDRVIGSPYDAVSKDFLVSAYFINAAWGKDHADLLKRFIAAMYETAAWANRDHVKSADLLVQYTKIDPAMVSAMTRVRYGERLTAAMLQPVVDVSAKYGGFPTYPAQQLIYTPPR
ncbi:MAG TPA: ABC transporter substrate-binding protein [Candidatus Lustribacter sp.]|nr:ABC transporter substrate-binding protein [Candidatus Lustribacter sp.]